MAAQRRRSDKLLERMKNNPRGDWKLSDGETLAKRYGFSIRRPRGGGSHVTLLQPRIRFEHSRPSSDKVCLYSETCADD